MNYVYIADVRLLVYSQCIIWEITKPIFLVLEWIFMDIHKS